MKVNVGRITVHGQGLEARRLADRLAQELPAALSSALAGAPPGPGPAGEAARAIVDQLRPEIGRHGLTTQVPMLPESRR